MHKPNRPHTNLFTWPSLTSAIVACLIGTTLPSIAKAQGNGGGPNDPQTSGAIVRTSNCPLQASSIPPIGSENGNFEDTSIPPGQSQVAPMWGSWQFTGRSGIVHQNHPLAQANGSAANGAYVAYLQGGSQIAVSPTLNAGIYRIRYFASRRAQNGSFNNQGVAISVNGVLLAQDDVPEVPTYTSFATRPFSVQVGASTPLIELDATQSLSTTILLDDIILERVCDWDVATNWIPAGIPQIVDTAVIQEGHLMALPSITTIESILSTGQLLTLNRNTQVFTGDMLITGPEALFEVGHRNVPFLQDFTLTLTGAGQFVNGVNEKFLMARNGGLISLHGIPKRSWTRLLNDAGVGANSIMVPDTTNWRVDDELVIVGSEGQHADALDPTASVHIPFSERRTIDNVNPPTGQQVEIEFGLAQGAPDPLVYRHFGAASPSVLSNGARSWVLDNRAEVGCLTRNVKITSIDYGANEFGGHIMIMRNNEMDEVAGVARFSNVELSKLGQRAGLGRYPFHWHMCKDLTQSQYIVNCSIYDTFNRAITIHGTDNAVVENNLVYRSHGHAVFLEDGSEQDNTITGNLVVGTIRPLPGNQTIESDNEEGNFQNRTPASFWITNPQNTINNNVAADSVGTGFWFALPREVLGLSSTNSLSHGSGNPDAHNPDAVPHLMDLESFDGNLAHGCRTGLDFHDGVSTGLGNTSFSEGQLIRNLQWFPASGSATLSNFTTYANDLGVYSGTGVYLRVSTGITLVNSVIADNNIGVRFASSDNVEGSVFISKSRLDFYQVSPLAIPDPPDSREVYEAYRIYDGAGRIDDCHFIGYDEEDSVMFRAASAAVRDTYIRVSNLSARGLGMNPINTSKFSFRDHLARNVNAQDDQPGSWGFSLLDEDGSMTNPTSPQNGYAGHSLTSNHAWMTDVGLAGVSLPGQWAHVAPYRFGHMIVLQPNSDPPNVAITFPHLECKRRRVDNQSVVSTYRHIFRAPVADPTHGSSFLKQLPLTVSDLTGNAPTANDRHYYEFTWTQEEPDSFKLKIQGLQTKDVALVCFSFSSLVNPTINNGAALVPATSMAEVMDLSSYLGQPVFFFDVPNSKLYLRILKDPRDGFIEIVR